MTGYITVSNNSHPILSFYLCLYWILQMISNFFLKKMRICSITRNNSRHLNLSPGGVKLNKPLYGLPVLSCVLLLQLICQKFPRVCCFLNQDPSFHKLRLIKWPIYLCHSSVIITYCASCGNKWADRCDWRLLGTGRTGCSSGTTAGSYIRIRFPCLTILLSRTH